MTTAICSDVATLREHVAAWRARGLLVALVPTMGALHDGHMALIAAAREIADRVVVTIFVNPAQFAANEDLASYPRDFDGDCAKIDAAGADLAYAPEIETMYPRGFVTAIRLEGPAAAGLEDAFRPTHFVGVATVVMKLLMQALPNMALFGEKDWQQLKMIERMAVDLDVPIGVIGVPTVREADGLAMSSRNLRLDADARAIAPALYRELEWCAAEIATGAEVGATVKLAREALEAEGFSVDYVEVRHAITLAALGDEDEGPARVLAAARIGGVRLIDNVPVDG